MTLPPSVPIAPSAPQPASPSANRPAAHDPVRSTDPVTVVVPTHRRPELMRAAVLSVLEQDHAGALEVLVVFDACDVELPDVPTELLDGSHGERTLRGLPNDRSRGLAGARNTGILAARHDLVAFLDDDDEWLPGKLTAQVRALEDDPSLVLVGTAMLVDDGRRLIERRTAGERVSHDDLLHARLAGPHASSFLIRRAALLGELGLVDESLPRSYGEDYDLLLRATSLGDVGVVDTPLITARWQGQSYYYAQWAAYAEALQYLVAKHTDLLASPAAASRLHSQIAFALAASGERRAARREVRAALRGSPRNLRAWLALAIALRLASADRVARVAQRFGKGI